MQISASTIYLISLISSISSAVSFLMILFGLGTMFMGICCVNEQCQQRLLPWIKKGFIAGCVCLAVTCFVPNKTDLCAMYVLPKITADTGLTIQQFPKGMAERTERWLGLKPYSGIDLKRRPRPETPSK